MKTLKIVGTALALIFCLELQAYEASVFLKRQWSEGVNRMCQYQDGTVLNMKSRSCPSKMPKSGGNAQSDYLMKEQLRLGQQSTQMMTNGMSQMTGGKGLIPLMLERLQGKTSEKQMENLLNDYPNAKSTLRDPEFLQWATEDDRRFQILQQALKGNVQSLDSLLTVHEFMTLAKRDSNFGDWVSRTIGRAEAERSIKKGDKTGDYSWFKKTMQNYKNSNISRSHADQPSKYSPQTSQRSQQGGLTKICKGSMADGSVRFKYVKTGSCPVGFIEIRR